jgi:hypothetical protein
VCQYSNTLEITDILRTIILAILIVNKPYTLSCILSTTAGGLLWGKRLRRLFTLDLNFQRKCGTAVRRSFKLARGRLLDLKSFWLVRKRCGRKDGVVSCSKSQSYLAAGTSRVSVGRSCSCPHSLGYISPLVVTVIGRRNHLSTKNTPQIQ